MNINNFVFADNRSGIKRVFIPGNHDQFFCTDGRRLFNSGAFSLFSNICDGEKDRLGGYGYFDIEDAKVRVIYLNTSDVPNATTTGTLLAISQEQKNWLCEILIDTNLKDNSNDWKILLLSHAPLDFGSLNIDSDILLAYINGETYGNYTFTNNNAQIISSIHGHVHCYSYGCMLNKIRRFTIPNACYIGNNHYGSREGYEDWVDNETYNKTPNTGKDTSFSLITMDLDNGICYVDNYGAGIDREFTINQTTAIPIEISNITYSGITTIGTIIDIGDIQYKVTYDDGTYANKTGNILLSSNIIEILGDNSITITYTENNTSITGELIITGTEVPIGDNILNINRTYVSGPANESITSYLDESKAYLNTSVFYCTFYDNGDNIINDVTENSVLITESGIGGIGVAYPVYIGNLTSKSCTLSFDCSGSGKCRTYFRYAKTDGTLQPSTQNIHINDTAGVDESITIGIPIDSNYDWLIIMLGSNTGGTKYFTNISLVEN